MYLVNSNLHKIIKKYFTHTFTCIYVAWRQVMYKQICSRLTFKKYIFRYFRIEIKVIFYFNRFMRQYCDYIIFFRIFFFFYRQESIYFRNQKSCVIFQSDIIQRHIYIYIYIPFLCKMRGKRKLKGILGLFIIVCFKLKFKKYVEIFTHQY